jgi:hydroxymethylbilane synthase
MTTFDRPLRIGTRNSALAMAQATQVQAALLALGHASEIVPYVTIGDRRLDVALNAIGTKGLFTAELEADLRAGTTDLCVHSLKDLPTDDPDGLAVVAQLPREDPRDALVVRDDVTAVTLADLPAGAIVGTSSLRRRAQLRALRPDCEIVELRGNVGTRLGKLDKGVCHAAILAAAGLHRLNESARIRSYLAAPAWLPAPGQGAIAIQVRADDARVRHEIERLDHAATSRATRAERAFLGALEGGCQVPVGALVTTEAGGAQTLHGLVAALDGATVLRRALPIRADAAPETAGLELADAVMADGAGEILAAIRA